MWTEFTENTRTAAPSRTGRFHRRAAFAWLLFLMLCSVWISVALVRGYGFDTSILALLPDLHGGEDTKPALSQRVDEHLAELANRRMVFLVSHPERRQSAAAAAQFLNALDQTSLFAELQGPVGGRQAEDWRNTFFPYRYHLLSAETRRALREETVDRQHPLLQQALARLYSPLASAVGPTLIEDPLQLFFQWQLAAAPKTAFAIEEGWLTREYRGRTYRLITLTLAGNPYELSYQQDVMGALGEAEAVLPEGAQVLRSGLLPHAAHGAAQARREISTIGVGSLLGITLLLLYCFRRGRFLLLAFLPIVAGWLFALAVSMALFDSLHLITLAFGASLIGVAIDYSLHYLSAFHEGAGDAPPDGRPALARILPAISLGLFSSAMAYAAQGLAPFPGLRQMAVFSVCGLAGAWLTVVLWLPYLSGRRVRDDVPLHRLAAVFARWLERWPTVASPRVAFLMAALTGLGVVQFYHLEFSDHVRHLQTSPQSMLNQDAQVQSLTRSIDPSRYFVVSAGSEEELLEAEERLQAKLRGLVNQGRLHDFQAVSRWVPSAAVQEENHELYKERIFSDPGLAALLAMEIGSPRLVERMRVSFEAGTVNPLSVENWLASDVGKRQSFLWLGKFEQQIHSLVMLADIGDEATLQQLSGFAKIDDRVRFVDKVGTISQVLKKHRQQLQVWIALAYGAVFLLLIWRYGLEAWRILAAPVVASLLGLAILNWCGFTINIFNLLALLLVLGIGLDAGIFLSESSRGHYTWTAITLAATTTLLAFGLLALSSTPVLQQFGVTVLVGIIGVWCLAPCFVERSLVRQRPVADSNSEARVADSRA